MSAIGWFAVIVLGGAGAIGRFALDAAIAGRFGGPFPFGTLAVNLSGAFALGLLDGLGVTDTATTLIGTAMLGSFTTFSTWVLETQRLAEDGETASAWLNLGVSLFAGLAAVVLGHLVGTLL